MKTVLIAQKAHLKNSQMLSSVGLWKRLMKVAKLMLCNEVRLGMQDIYLGLTYKETNAIWRLARVHI